MCAGGIHDSGNRPISNSSRRCRASAQSVFARFFLPFNAAASAGSARCTSAPIRSSSSTTNRQPVVASSATSKPASLNGARNFRTPARSAGAILARDTSPVIVSIHSAEICARCWSRPITTDTRSPPRCPGRRRAREHRSPTAQPIAYRELRSVPPLRSAGRAAAIRACLLAPFDVECRPPSRPSHTPTGT